MMLYKTGNVTVAKVSPRTGKLSEVHRVSPIESGKVYLELDGLDGDRFNSNFDLFPYYPDYCRSCHKYVYDMTYRGIKMSAIEDDICPDCGGKMDGGLLAENSRGVPAWKSWIGKPLCVAHQSDDPTLHYGEILDAVPYDEMKTVRMVVAADRDKLSREHPGLLESYEKGLAKDVSQGSQVGYSLCSKCMNLAEKEEDYCDHLKHHRGQLLPIEDGDHPYPHAIEREDFVRIGEICYDVDGFEVSLVNRGACDVAKVRNVLKESAAREHPNGNGMVSISVRDLYALLDRYIHN